MNGRVLITGANGFIGYHLTKAVLKAGFSVDAAVRKGSDLALLQSINNNQLSYVQLNYASLESLQEQIKLAQYDYVIHTAGATKASNWDAYYQTNAANSAQLAKASLASSHLKRFVFISSLAALGPIQYQETLPITEQSTPQPVTSYGKSKLVAERELLAIPELPMTIIRPTAVYGPAEKDIFIMFKMFAQGIETYIGHQPQKLSFVYVEDLVAAIVLALKPSEIMHSTYNISDGNVYSRYELAELFKKATGKKTFLLHLPEVVVKALAIGLEGISKLTGKTSVLNREKINELTAQNWQCSIEAAVKDLGYKPQNDLSIGIAKTIAWYQENKWL
jgi:nucleoside-diphosphate-sugar epimerase